MRTVHHIDAQQLSDDHLIEHRTGSEEIFRGRLLHVMRDTVRLPDGGSATREYIRHPGAVAIVALMDDGRVVLERQFRYPVGKVVVEIPAGKLERGEDPLLCAQRELLEETGYVAREWAFASKLNPVVAFADEVIHLWFCRGLEMRKPQLDEGEFIEVFAAAPAEMLAMCRAGEITDAKTLMATLWLQNVQSGAWDLQWHAAGEKAPGG